MLYFIAGLSLLGVFTGIAFWLIHQGKTIAKAEEMAKKLTAADIISKKKNEYIKTVDHAVQRSKEYDDKIHAEFNRDGGPDANNVLRIIRAVSEDTTPDKPKDAG